MIQVTYVTADGMPRRLSAVNHAEPGIEGTKVCAAVSVLGTTLWDLQECAVESVVLDSGQFFWKALCSEIPEHIRIRVEFVVRALDLLVKSYPEHISLS